MTRAGLIVAARIRASMETGKEREFLLGYVKGLRRDDSNMWFTMHALAGYNEGWHIAGLFGLTT